MLRSRLRAENETITRFNLLEIMHDFHTLTTEHSVELRVTAERTPSFVDKPWLCISS